MNLDSLLRTLESGAFVTHDEMSEIALVLRELHKDANRYNWMVKYTSQLLMLNEQQVHNQVDVAMGVTEEYSLSEEDSEAIRNARENRQRLEIGLADFLLEEAPRDELFALAHEKMVDDYSKLSANELLTLVEHFAPDLLDLLDENHG